MKQNFLEKAIVAYLVRLFVVLHGTRGTPSKEDRHFDSHRFERFWSPTDRNTAQCVCRDIGDQRALAIRRHWRSEGTGDQRALAIRGHWKVQQTLKAVKQLIYRVGNWQRHK